MSNPNALDAAGETPLHRQAVTSEWIEFKRMRYLISCYKSFYISILMI